MIADANLDCGPREPPSRSSCRTRQWLHGTYSNRLRGSELKGYRLHSQIF